MLDEFLKQCWSILSQDSSRAIEIKSQIFPITYRPNQKLLGPIRIHEKAVTIYDPQGGKSQKRTPFLQLPTNKQVCDSNPVKVIEVFHQYLAHQERKTCFKNHENRPIEGCSDLYIGRFFKAPVTKEEHDQWHSNNDTKYHTHIVKSRDRSTLVALDEKDIQCIFKTYRDSTKIFKGLYEHDRDKPDSEGEIKALNPDDFITEKEIQEIINLYKNRHEKLNKFFNNLTELTKAAFLEAFFLTFISELMQRYILPKIRFHNDSLVVKNISENVNNIIPLLILAYRFYLGVNAFSSSLVNLACYLIYLSVDKVFSNNLMAENIGFAINLFSIFNFRSGEINEEGLAKVIGFEVGKMTTKNAMVLAEKLASFVINTLPKLKEEDNSKPHKTEVISNKRKQGLNKRR